MHELRLPWLGLCILLPAVGAIWVKLARDPDSARRYSLIASGLALACALAAWWDFQSLGTFEAREGWDPLAHVIHKDLLVVDELSAPKLPLAALIYFLTNLATLRSKVREFSFSRALGSESILLATLACKLPWGVVTLMVAGTVPPYLELRKGHGATRIYFLHMGLFVVMLCSGQALLSARGPSPYSQAGLALLAGAMLLRGGVAPLHCWMADLFERATFGTALLFVTPMVGTYGVARLVLPVAPPWALQAISTASLSTAVHAAGMALVQREARRFFCYLFLSHSSLVLVGIGSATPLVLTGALSLWLSVALSLTGFGLTIRCLESRTGRIPLSGFQGLYRHVPLLAAFFLLTGLASVGFPGTAGFVGLELLVEGTARAGTLVGAGVVTVAALNGLAVMHAYFRIFTGERHTTAIDLRVRPAEQVAVLVLTALILGGGLYPQPGVTSRYHAADELYKMRIRSIRPDSFHGVGAKPRQGANNIKIEEGKNYGDRIP
jgi:NADH-quinone oxidoreductase subunit M